MFSVFNISERTFVERNKLMKGVSKVNLLRNTEFGGIIMLYIVYLVDLIIILFLVRNHKSAVEVIVETNVNTLAYSCVHSH